MNTILLPKEHNEIPDYYGIRIDHIDGKVSEYQGSHSMVLNGAAIQICTFEDEWVLIPMANIRKVSFDKNFSKLIAVKEKTNGRR